MNLKCATCLHTPPGDTDIAQASDAITVISGLAVCEAHLEWMSLPEAIEDALVEERG